MRPGARQTPQLSFRLAANPRGFGMPARRTRRRTIVIKAAFASAFFLAVIVGSAPPSMAQQPAAPVQKPSDVVAAYNTALAKFKAVLAERRSQIEAKKPLPNLPGQAVYLARLGIMSTYKDLTDAIPSRIGRPNKFGIPPAYFDADIEPLIEEYRNLFSILEAPPANAQASATPLKDVVDLSRAIARVKGLDEANVDTAGLIGLGIFYAETN